MLLPRQIAKMKLGALCGAPSSLPTLLYTDPKVLPAWDRIEGTPRVQGENDRYGDCVPTAACNAIQTFLARQGVMTPIPNELAFQIYQANGGMPADVGLVPEAFLTWWKSNPIQNVRLADWTPIEPTDLATIKQTISGQGFVYATAILSVAQQNQIEWNYDSASPVWSGHAFLIDKYEADDFFCTTWGEERALTPAFLANQSANLYHLEFA